jgi:HEAT repeat protein
MIPNSDEQPFSGKRLHWAELTLLSIGLGAITMIAWCARQLWTPQEPLYHDVALSSWVNQLDSRNVACARHAIFAMGPQAGPYLLDEVRKDESRRGRVVDALTAVGRAAVPALLRAFGDQSSDVRFVAVQAISSLASNLGDQDQQVVSALIELMSDRQGEIRFAAILALSRVPTGKGRAVQALVAALENDTAGPAQMRSDIRQKACRVLGEIGPPAKSAIPALGRLLSDGDSRTRSEAAKALCSFHVRHPAMPKVSNFVFPFQTILNNQRNGSDYTANGRED